jgi:hypothetical protein
MDVDEDAFPGSGSGSGSEGDLIEPNAAALQAVAVPPARRRSRSHGSPGLSSSSPQHSSVGRYSIMPPTVASQRSPASSQPLLVCLGVLVEDKPIA